MFEQEMDTAKDVPPLISLGICRVSATTKEDAFICHREISALVLEVRVNEMPA